MHWSHPRAFQILLASALAVSTVAGAAPRDSASGLASGKRMHKPYTASVEGGSRIAPASCAETNVQPVMVASDPEEGGQIARTADPKPTVTEIQVSHKVDTASPKLANSAPAPDSSCTSVQH